MEYEQYECCSRIFDSIVPHTNIVPSSGPRLMRDSNSAQYIIPNLVKETYNPDDRSIFINRRLTALPDGRLALVPASAETGDHIVCLAGSKVPYVLRRYTKESQVSDIDIYDCFAKKADFKSCAPRGCIECYINMKTCDDQKPLCGYCQINEKHSCKKYQIHNTQSMPIAHYYFIGECFVETLMMGWTAPELERGKKIIFALH